MGDTIIITTGTFLRGLMHIGQSQQSGGRSGEAAVSNLSDSLKEIGLKLGRLKTGTPPRLLRRSIDFAQTEIQPGDEPIPYFTYWKDDLFHVEQSECKSRNQNGSNSKYPAASILQQIDGQLPCFITFTTEETAKLIRENIHKSPMYSGRIEGVGPRYCPSIEDKIVKFPDKKRHQIFLEPEGIATDEIYVNGFSTCLPFEVQIELVKTIQGCQNAEIMRPAYAVEYDFAFPSQLLPSLETKVCQNLYLAGQINGTSGYEEAAAQGLMAGINAARRYQGKDPVILRRDQAYIGVLIDDLIAKGTAEPYRMFTSRAEYRLLLRQDNADLRLSTIGHEVGLLQQKNYLEFLTKKDAIRKEVMRLENTRHGSTTLAQLLRRPELHYYALPSRDDSLTPEVVQQVETELKYAGYVERQEVEVQKFIKMEGKRIPEWMDYNQVPSLRTEARQKLNEVRPITIGHASRISGVSPADICLVMIWMKRGPQISDDTYTTSCSDVE